MSNVLTELKQCRVCGSSQIETVLKLADTPLEDQFLPADKAHVDQPTYPLQLAICQNCGYAYLPHVVSPQASYADYIYESSVTVGLRDHYDSYASSIVEQYKLSPDSLVVDLGSNDGSMLHSFKKIGMRVVGVEPATAIANRATEQGVTTIADFFTDQVRERIVSEYGKASAVTANYMFANVDDLDSFVMNVEKLLAPDGLFIVQTGYHPEQMKINMFDYIYHEHFSYFSVEVLGKLFKKFGLQLIEAQVTKPKGGSIRVVAQKIGASRLVDESVARLVAQERKDGIHQSETYRNWAKRLEKIRERVVQDLQALKDDGLRIVGLGASHSTTTLIYHFALRGFMEYIVDDNSLKHGTLSPGYKIPVYPTDKLYTDKPDVVIVLAWQHQDTILKRHEKFGLDGGKFYIPLPEPELKS